MAITDCGRTARNYFERLFDALVDEARCERAMALLLCGYAVLWTLYAIVAKSSQDIHFDMGELVAWSRDAGLGTPKHPPLAAWIVGLWFDFFPLRDWAYYLLAVIAPTVSMWIAWRVSASYLSAEKRVVGLLLLTLVPFYNFHALKFNANAVLLPCWAATTWWFLRSLATRRAGWAALTGVGAAASMLGKYWSIFLLAGLATAALADPRRATYFRSPAPWLSAGVAAVLLAPHVAWIVAHHFEPFRYALAVHEAPFAAAALSSLRFLLGTLAYVAVPIALTVLAARPDAKTVADTVWPPEPERRTALVAFAAPLVLAPIVAVLLMTRVVSLWAMPAMTLLPTVLLSSSRVEITRNAAVRLLVLAIGFPFVMVAVSPLIAIAIHREGLNDYAGHYRLIAQAMQRAWDEHTNSPLQIVGSYSELSNGVLFYVDGHPSTFDVLDPARTPWVDEGRISREGIAMVCPVSATACVQEMQRWATRHPGTDIENVVLARRFFGALDTPVHYRILVIPPEAHQGLNNRSRKISS